MKELVFALDLKNDPKKIKEYIAHHENVWPEVVQTIKDSGVMNMRIYQLENRLFMIVDVHDAFSLENDTIGNPKHPKVQEWEKLMWNYQQRLPFAKPGEKWVLMHKIFEL